jgi:hypothetical protein
MAELSNFQSLLQLSVALNITFTIVISIFGNSVSREKLIIQNLLSQARDARARATAEGLSEDLKVQSMNIWTECLKLNKQIEGSIDRVDYLAFERFRPIAIVGAVTCFALLVITSYLPTISLFGNLWSWVIQVLAVASLLPFLCFVVWSAHYASAKSHEARSKRIQLDDELNTLVDKLNQPAATPNPS